MKKLGLILIALALVPALQAQENTKTIAAPQNPGISTGSKPNPFRAQPQQTSPESTTGTGKVEESKVKGTGLIFEMSEKGLVIISPTAPASYGYGTKAVITNTGAPGNPGSTEVNANDRVVDGLALIGWSW